MIRTANPTPSSTNKTPIFFIKDPPHPTGGLFLSASNGSTMDIEKYRDEKCCKQFIWKGSNYINGIEDK